MKRILIIGGYGNFGSFISERLSKEPDISIVIAGRSGEKAKAFAKKIKSEYAVIDITQNLDSVLDSIKPDILIHTCGPFQGQGYDVAEACIRHKCHYIDLADGREFVAQIQRLDQSAKDAGVMIVSGASSVPCLTAAIIDRYLPYFKRLESIDYGIATAQKTNPGLATTSAILNYAGKAFTTLQNGKTKTIYGWQNLTVRKYPELGYRLLSNCDVPDLELFPTRYKDLKDIRFKAGLEVPFLHIGLWALSWLVRTGILKSLKPFAVPFYNAGPYFNIFGTNRSAFHIEMSGVDSVENPVKRTFYILTDSGHGPNIPCVPSILLAIKMARNEISQTGAQPCLDMIGLDDYLNVLSEFDIKWVSE